MINTNDEQRSFNEIDLLNESDVVYVYAETLECRKYHRIIIIESISDNRKLFHSKTLLKGIVDGVYPSESDFQNLLNNFAEVF